MSSGARGSLAWRLFAFGVAQVVLSVLIGDCLIRRASGPPAPPERPLGMEWSEGPPAPPHPPEPRRGGRPPPPRAERGLPPPVLNLLVGLVMVGGWAFVVGRWVVVPLRRLTQAARAFGAGNLATRAHLSRADELGEVGKAFDEMAARLQSSIRAEKELLANVSHELRTPLARIRVALDLASEGDAEAARASLAEIGVDLNELESILDAIFTTARLEIAADTAGSSGLPLRRAPTSPEVVARQAAERFRTAHPARPLVLSVHGELAPVALDMVLFRRVLDNLLENAHKYSPDPGAAIELTVDADEAGSAFTVRDRGMGIAAEDVPHLFTPFFRSERSRTRAEGGVGLGLTLVKRIVDGHGGSVTVTTGPEGSAFRVVLPRATTSADVPGADQ